MYDWKKEHCERCVADKSLCKDCKDNPIYADYPMTSHFMAYVPVCPRGYSDCVNDPAYILFYHPTYYKEIFGDKTPLEVLWIENGCMESYEKDPEMKYYCYDDEDK